MMNNKKTIGVSLFSYYDLSTRDARATLFQILLECGGVFVPDRVRTGQGMQRFAPQPVEGWIDTILWPGRDIENPQWFEACRRRPYDVDMHLGWAPEVAHAGRFFYWLIVDLDFLQSGVEAQAQFWKLTKDLYLWSHAVFGAIHDAEESLQQTLRLPDCLSDPLWGNFYGPEYVDMFGRQGVLHAPCHSIELLPDGGVFLTLSGDISRAQRIRLKSEIRQLKEYLGPDAFDCDTKEGIPHFRFRERTIERSLREMLILRRHYYQGKLLGWALTPEEISQAIGELQGLLASVAPQLDFSPESLPTLERAFASRWQADHNKADTLSDEDLVRLARGICAYFGEVCIRNLGLEWVTGYTPLIQTSLQSVDASGRSKWVLIMEPVILCWDEDFPSASQRDRLMSWFEYVKAWKSE
ncbi:MAG: hypothetical protein P8186_30390 [Anaerolineae bacterium]|jgi:hypothetical protein